MARLRKNKNKTLPPNLYEGINHYYKYRRPDTGKWHSMGKDREKAISAAKQLNSILMTGRNLVEKVTRNAMIFNHFIDEFENKIIPEKNLAFKTVSEYKNQLKHIRVNLGSNIIDEIAVLEIAEFLKKFPPTLANRYRSLLVIIFKHAIANGLCYDNPAEKTLVKKIIKKRKRLSLEEYQAIYDKSELWLKNAMDLGLQTLQRREEIVEMKFSDIKDGDLYVIQKKTEKHGKAARIRIKIESPLKEIIERCRDGLLSPYLIHRKPDRFNLQNTQAESKKHITQLTPNYLTKAFARIRDQLDVFKNVPLDERPTFHEIRSLGIKLYEDKGIDAQMLAGHTTRTMTDNYKKGHESEWTNVVAGLSL